MTLRAILFDAGNTLLFLDYDRLAPAVSAAIAHPLTAAGLAAQSAEAARQLEQGTVTDRERATAYLESLFLMAGAPAERLEGVRTCLWRLHQERHLWSASHPRTAEALGRLRAAGVRLAVVSNSDGRAEEGLRAAGLRDYFDVVLDSGLVGIEKPDPRIFQVALDALNVSADEALYVGDIYEVDVVGARAAGRSVVLVDPLGSHAGRDVTTVANIGELVDELMASGRIDPGQG